MKAKTPKPRADVLTWAAIFGLALSLGAGHNLAQKSQNSTVGPTNPTSPADKQAVSIFEGRVSQYLKLRNRVKEKLPKLSKDSTPEQIEAYRTSLEAGLRTARTGARRGDLFVPEVADYIRRTLRNEFRGRDRKDIREIVFDAETQGVPVRVNYEYPENKEFTEMPPTLLLKLPQLPKEVRYRFVGSNLLLVDRESNLIIDYMVDALP